MAEAELPFLRGDQGGKDLETLLADADQTASKVRAAPALPRLGRGDETVGNPHRAQISQFELFELILLLKLDKQFPIEQFEPTVSQSTVPSPPLRSGRRCGSTPQARTT